MNNHGGIEEIRKQSNEYVVPIKTGKLDYLHTGGMRPLSDDIKHYLLHKYAKEAARYLDDSSAVYITAEESEALTYAFIRFIEENMEQ